MIWLKAGKKEQKKMIAAIAPIVNKNIKDILATVEIDLIMLLDIYENKRYDGTSKKDAIDKTIEEADSECHEYGYQHLSKLFQQILEGFNDTIKSEW